MSRKFIDYSIIALVVSLLLVLTGCGSGGAGNDENTGTIKLNISSQSGTKSILPDIDMIPAKYIVIGTGPEVAVFNLI